MLQLLNDIIWKLPEFGGVHMLWANVVMEPKMLMAKIGKLQVT